MDNAVPIAKIITIDGPSAVGKGTMAKRLASDLGYHLLDSGALYRLVAVNALQQRLDPNIASDAEKAVQNLHVEFDDDKVYLNGTDVTTKIREENVSKAASQIAVHASVRRALFAFMQAFVKLPGIVADGRDMGTVVFPHADVKLFLTAVTAVRAERRYKQLSKHAKNVTLDAVFSELVDRDARDSTRDEAPLIPAEDAVVIDTSVDTEAQVYEKIMQTVRLGGILP